MNKTPVKSNTGVQIPVNSNMKGFNNETDQ